MFKFIIGGGYAHTVVYVGDNWDKLGNPFLEKNQRIQLLKNLILQLVEKRKKKLRYLFFVDHFYLDSCQKEKDHYLLKVIDLDDSLGVTPPTVEHVEESKERPHQEIKEVSQPLHENRKSPDKTRVEEKGSKVKCSQKKMQVMQEDGEAIQKIYAEFQKEGEEIKKLATELRSLKAPLPPLKYGKQGQASMQLDKALRSVLKQRLSIRKTLLQKIQKEQQSRESEPPIKTVIRELAQSSFGKMLCPHWEDALTKFTAAFNGLKNKESVTKNVVNNKEIRQIIGNVQC